MTSRLRIAALFLSLALNLWTLEAAADVAVAAPSAPQIAVEVTNLRNSDGRVGCSLFPKEDGFPADSTKAVQRVWCKIEAQVAHCAFPAVPPGVYAVACFHDEDGDGALKTGLFGVPKEGTVVSNHAKGFMGPPKFKDAKWSYGGQSVVLHLQMGY